MHFVFVIVMAMVWMKVYLQLHRYLTLHLQRGLLTSNRLMLTDYRPFFTFYKLTTLRDGKTSKWMQLKFWWGSQTNRSDSIRGHSKQKHLNLSQHLLQGYRCQQISELVPPLRLPLQHLSPNFPPKQGPITAPTVLWNKAIFLYYSRFAWW